MKKIVIASIVVGILSISLTIGFVFMKLNNYNLLGIKSPKISSKLEKNKKNHNEKETTRPKSNLKKEEVKENKSDEIKYEIGKAPDFEGCSQRKVYDFAQKHGINYELDEPVITSNYDLKGKVAKQSIKPNKNMSKDETLKISIYLFDENYK